MSILRLFLFFTCFPYLAFGSGQDWFDYGNMFSPKKTQTENNTNNNKNIQIENNDKKEEKDSHPTLKSEPRNEGFKYENLFSSKKTNTEDNNTNNQNKNNDKKEEKGHYPKYPNSHNIPDDHKPVGLEFSGENLLITLQNKDLKKITHLVPVIENLNLYPFLGREGDLCIKFDSFTGKELSSDDCLEISTYFASYHCSIGGYATIKYNETITVPKKDIQFINFKLKTDKKSAIGYVNRQGKNYFVGERREKNLFINHKAGMIELYGQGTNPKSDLGSNTDIVYLHVCFENGAYKYGYSYVPYDQVNQK